MAETLPESGLEPDKVIAASLSNTASSCTDVQPNGGYTCAAPAAS